MEQTTKQKIMQLDTAHEEPIWEGNDKILSESWKAIYNDRTQNCIAHVSSNYQLVQHRDVADSMVEALSNLNIKHEVNVINGENLMILDINFPDAKLYVKKGEEFTAGFRLINSYNKSSGIIIAPKLVRLICDNGMVINSKNFVKTFQCNHTSKQVNDFESQVQIMLKEVINASDKLKAMINDCIGDSVEWAITDSILKKVFNFPKKHSAKILEKLDSSKPVTRWDLYNALTDYATHNEQLRPRIEMYIQSKANNLFQNKFETLLAKIPVE